MICQEAERNYVDGDFDEDAIDDWSMRTWGEAPMEIFLWSSIDRRHEVMLKFSNMVVVALLLENDSGEFSNERQILIRVNEWNPGSVQANRMADGSIKVRFRRQDVTLSPMMRPHDALSSMLEEWLMSMRGEPDRHRDRTKRLIAVKRHRDAVSRMLDQASIEKLNEAYGEREARLSRAEDELGGRVFEEETA